MVGELLFFSYEHKTKNDSGKTFLFKKKTWFD